MSKLNQERDQKGGKQASNDDNQKVTDPLNSRNLQITLATTSSFLSSGTWGRTLVRLASFSDAVAPRQSTKSIVED